MIRPFDCSVPSGTADYLACDFYQPVVPKGTSILIYYDVIKIKYFISFTPCIRKYEAFYTLNMISYLENMMRLNIIFIDVKMLD